MKWAIRILAWAALAALLVAAPGLIARLPSTSEGLVAQSYAQWSGVLRLWVHTGWTPGAGSFTAWLNTCIAKFEKRNPGVYVQVQPMTQAMAASFASGSNPPDAMLIAPGLLTSPAGLLSLPESEGVRADLQGVGLCEGVRYAQIVAMGGYAWALNAAYLGEAPLNWGELAERPEAPARSKLYPFWMQSPRDAPFLSWSAALLSLCADRIVSEEGPAPVRAGEGIDLGLVDAEPTPTPAPAQLLRVDCQLPLLLPDDFRAEESAYADFTAGRAAAIPVTQREIRRLQLLSDTGKGPEWTIEAVGDNFTDQLALFCVVDLPKNNLDERQELCVKLMRHLLADESQQALATVRALRVTNGAPLYSQQRGMAQLEAAYMNGLQTVDAFDSSWRDQRKRQADAFQQQS